VTQMEFYLHFQASHPLVIVEKPMFDFLQPLWIVLTSLIAMCEIILCPKRKGVKWHAHDCLFGNCTL
jgi:hypothetical protein